MPAGEDLYVEDLTLVIIGPGSLAWDNNGEDLAKWKATPSTSSEHTN